MRLDGDSHSEIRTCAIIHYSQYVATIIQRVPEKAGTEKYRQSDLWCYIGICLKQSSSLTYLTATSITYH